MASTFTLSFELKTLFRLQNCIFFFFWEKMINCLKLKKISKKHRFFCLCLAPPKLGLRRSRKDRRRLLCCCQVCNMMRWEYFHYFFKLFFFWERSKKLLMCFLLYLPIYYVAFVVRACKKTLINGIPGNGFKNIIRF